MARHSDLMDKGRGDPRDRRAPQLTDNAIDPDFFEFDTQGRLTLKAGVAGGVTPGRGLQLAPDGSLELNLARSLSIDRDGKLAVTFLSTLITLIDNTAGTVSDTLAAIPDPADAPVDADFLREDLVANTLPPLRNALASLVAKLNAILDAASTSVRT